MICFKSAELTKRGSSNETYQDTFTYSLSGVPAPLAGISIFQKFLLQFAGQKTPPRRRFLSKTSYAFLLY